ncbi:MAG: twin-arginine translocase TatA/TatE family subunit [Desulfobacteraceae bacterium]|nr:twin-arginine translocase TatA/TatE family subunit [Desulfobacteraceae bacterium]
MFEGLFQPLHLLIILAIALLIFGPGKLPQLGEGLGKSIREFKKALDGSQTMLEDKKQETQAQAENKTVHEEKTV